MDLAATVPREVHAGERVDELLAERQARDGEPRAMPRKQDARASSAGEVASREPSRAEAGGSVHGARMRSGFVVEPLEATFGVLLSVDRMVHEDSFLEATGWFLPGTPAVLE